MALNFNYKNYGNQLNNADTLVINYSNKHVFFCEIEIDTFKPVFIGNFSFSENDHNDLLLALVNHFQSAKKNYKSIYINYFSEKFTICPQHFYEETNKKDLLEFNCGTIGNNIVLENDINQNIKIIYSISEVLKSGLDQLFPNHHLKHSTGILAQLMLNSKDLANENVLLNINETYIECVVKNEFKLLMMNQFSVKTEQDILYYLLFLLEQYEMNAQTVKVCLVGNINSDSDLYIILKKYIKNIRLATGHKNLIYSEIEGMPQHFNYTLLNRLFCE